ncbi:hypothetical protein PAERUG_E6_London_17_VIM_2_12_12_03017 [Pseudomonas aeruginosa]|nr:hypothetical protein PAERUG_E6_London_17_VIM_2_12_12_03017 [Pseudomonas aeruginosa]
MTFQLEDGFDSPGDILIVPVGSHPDSSKHIQSFTIWHQVLDIDLADNRIGGIRFP